jgi:hypothetical protein
MIMDHDLEVDGLTCLGCRPLQNLLLKGFFDEAVSDTDLPACKHVTAHPATAFQCRPGTCPDRLFHPRTRVTGSFDEDTHRTDAHALPYKLVQFDASHDDLTTAGPRGHWGSQETADLI